MSTWSLMKGRGLDEYLLEVDPRYHSPEKEAVVTRAPTV